jgi:hypothetical protein
VEPAEEIIYLLFFKDMMDKKRRNDNQISCIVE